MLRHLRRRRLRLGFGTRLALVVIAAFALVGCVGCVLIGRQIERQIMASHVAEQRADAGTFAAIGRRAATRGDAIAAVDQVLDAGRRRPGVLETLLIDVAGVVRWAGDADVVGSMEHDARIDAALRDGVAFSGRDGRHARDPRDLVFVIPVEIAGRRYAYQMVLDHESLDAELRTARDGLLWVGLLALLIGGVAFYLLGGRSLLRSHRVALHRATRDGLTDLPNQRAFHQDLPLAVATAARHGDPLVLMLLDTDDFKFINDRHGHPHGDTVLRRIAKVLREGRSGDLCYRIGGDEFAIVMPRTDGLGARSRSRRLLRVLGAANLAMSVGVAELSPGQSAEVLQREADAALYEAKRRGGNGAVHFDDVRGEVVITTTEKLNAIHQLLAEQRLDVVYQPIWNLGSGQLLGVEALARPHADYGFSGPAEAFDLAEQIGQVPQLDMLCVAEALEAVPELPSGALLFLNLSPRTLEISESEGDWILDAVTATGLDAERVVIEVTERFGGRTPAVVKGLQRLRERGFKLALDDVGTGNSGLEMLRLVCPEFVKLDRSIVIAAPEDSNARAVLMAMATYASHTGAFVIAEGIEDDELLEFIRRIDDGQSRSATIIPGGQGYGLGRPSPDLPTASRPQLFHAR